jgi:putative membrane protein
MRLAALAAVALLAVQGAAIAQATKPATSTKSETQRYVNEAAMTDKFEREAGQLAIVRGRAVEVKDYARMMVSDHNSSSDKIKDALKDANSNIKPPTKLDAVHQKKLDQLKGASEANFDRTYMDMMVKGHTQALALHRGYAGNGDVATLKKAAGEIAPVVQKHLEQANKIASVVSKPSSETHNSTTGLPRKGS